MEATRIDIKTTQLSVKDGQDIVYLAVFKNGQVVNLEDLEGSLESVEHETKKYKVIRTTLYGDIFQNYLVPAEWIPTLRKLFFDSREQYDRIKEVIRSTESLTTDKIKALSWWKRLFNKF